LIDQSFININEDTASGWDLNLLYQQDYVVLDRELGVTVDVTANYQEERGVTIVGADGTENFDDNVGEFGFPEWNGFIRVGLSYQDFFFTWSSRYIGEVSQDEEFVDEFGNITGDPALANTCLGEANGDVDCRDVGFANDYFRHDMSLSYDGGDWFVRGGVRNVFDKKPPLVDGDEVLARRNYPIGAGYDAFGRTYFFNVGKQF
jgi:iron complex outermembrane receptor protein